MNYMEVMKNELARRCQQNPRYSLRAFARALGFEATNISQIMSGKRIPIVKTAERIAKSLALSDVEAEQFIGSLIAKRRELGLKTNEPGPSLPSAAMTATVEIQHDVFRVMADWYHYGILALTQTRAFKSTHKWIASQLEISELEVKMAVERLSSLGLLEERDGKLASTHKGFTTANKASTDAALKRHQAQIMQKALHSLENDPAEDRSHTSMTMAIDPSKLPEAKLRIERFTQELSQFLETPRQERVFQLSIALFPIQKGSDI